MKVSRLLLHGFGVAALLGALVLVALLHTAHEPAWALGLLGLTALAAWIYLNPRCNAWRYIAPGALAALVFIVFPMLYTLGISFTNYSAEHLLSRERATQVLLARGQGDGRGLEFRLVISDSGPRLWFTDDDGTHYASAALKLGGELRVPLVVSAASTANAEPDLHRVVALLPALRRVVAVLPDGGELRINSLRRFTVSRPAYLMQADGTLLDTIDGARLHADLDQGFWRRGDGTAVAPGFRVAVGLQNYARIFGDPRFFEPFARVFGWTLSFATLNTVLTFGIGLLLASALNWDALRGKGFYRAALFLPYAVPAFISIPVFRGLFNENLGEINAVLDLLFGVRPGWFSDATLARSMVLIVNTWLGFPYMMILCMGLIKAIPGELYEASTLAGAGPFTNLSRITLPLIARPIAPLLVASFATNFNNLTLIELLTEGAPDYLDTQVPVGATDLLASYTYRIAFHDSGQHYALACAIASIVFLIVATLAVLNLRLFKVGRAAA